MKIAENSPTRFTITSRRPILADIGLLVFVGIGLSVAYGVAVGDHTPFAPIFVILGLGFAAFGAWGLIFNARATVSLDATTQSIRFRWRTLLGVENADWHFADLERVTVYEDEDMHTLQFSFAGSEPVLLERAYSTNPQAYEVARTVQDWLMRAGWKSATT